MVVHAYALPLGRTGGTITRLRLCSNPASLGYIARHCLEKEKQEMEMG